MQDAECSITYSDSPIPSYLSIPPYALSHVIPIYISLSYPYIWIAIPSYILTHRIYKRGPLTPSVLPWSGFRSKLADKIVWEKVFSLLRKYLLSSLFSSWFSIFFNSSLRLSVLCIKKISLIFLVFVLGASTSASLLAAASVVFDFRLLLYLYLWFGAYDEAGAV